MMLNEELQKYITECEQKYGSAPSRDVLNLWIGEYMQRQNSSALAQFDGYSPNEMSAIINGLWGADSPVCK